MDKIKGDTILKHRFPTIEGFLHMEIRKISASGDGISLAYFTFISNLFSSCSFLPYWEMSRDKKQMTILAGQYSKYLTFDAFL